MFSIFPDYSSSVTNTKPDIVLIQADRRYFDTAVYIDPDRPWQRFVDDLGERRLFQAHHLSRLRQVWKHIRDHVGPRLPLPVDGAIQLYWDAGNKYLEVEVYADGTLRWFYKDRAGLERDGSDDDRVRGVPSHLLSRLVSLIP